MSIMEPIMEQRDSNPESTPAVTPLVTDPDHILPAPEQPRDESGTLADHALKAVRVMLGILMLAMVALISIEVILRFFLNLPLDSVTEIASFLFVWLSMLGAAAAVPLGAHMAIHPLHNRVAPSVTAAAHITTTIAVLAFSIFLALSGYQFTASLTGETLPVTGVASAWEAAAFPASGALMVIFTLIDAVRDVRRARLRSKERRVVANASPLRNS